MKLKKAISLVLGGVLALSMLAGCSSSGSTNVTVETPTAANTNTSVVTTVKSLMTESKVGESQASWALTGNETADLKDVKDLVATNQIYAMMATSTIIEKTDFDSEIDSSVAGEQAIIVVKKGGSDDADLAQAIVDYMAAEYKKAQENVKTESNNNQLYCIKYLSVFDMEADTILADITLEDEAIIGEYWVVVVTNCPETVTTVTPSKETDNNTFVVE